MTVEVEKFGKDHWSTLAYVECCAVDDKGALDNRHMRCDADRHPGLVNPMLDSVQKYPTILAGGEELPDHDDWDCLDDLEAAGFIEQRGTGIHPVIKMTEAGNKVAASLRHHKSQGGNFSGFQWPLKLYVANVRFRDIAPIIPGPPRGREVGVVGEARITLLRAFYQGHLLGDLEAFVLGRGTIDRTDVDWSSAGESVTGK